MSLLEMIFGGAQSGAQLAGALMLVSIYLSVGVMAVFGAVALAPRYLSGVHQQYFWAAFLGAIALFYISFTAYFEEPADVWRIEVAVVGGFIVAACLGAISRPVLALGYLGHGVWDIIHSWYGENGFVRPLSEIPLGYGVFCLSFDVAMMIYIWRFMPDWSKDPGVL